MDRIVSMLTKLIQRHEEDAFSRSGSGESPGRVGESPGRERRGEPGSGAGAAVLGAGAFAGKNTQTMTRLGILYWPRNPASRSPILPILQFKPTTGKCMI